jgi:hypothetical protein
MHEHSTNRLVKKILKTIAQRERCSFAKIRKNFINGEMHVTHLFWEILAEKKPDHAFTEVSHCPDCGKFTLD